MTQFHFIALLAWLAIVLAIVGPFLVPLIFWRRK